jgi:hypothetical protein
VHRIRLFLLARSPSHVRLRLHRPGLHRQHRHRLRSARRHAMARLVPPSVRSVRRPRPGRPASTPDGPAPRPADRPPDWITRRYNRPNRLPDRVGPDPTGPRTGAYRAAVQGLPPSHPAPRPADRPPGRLNRRPGWSDRAPGRLDRRPGRSYRTPCRPFQLCIRQYRRPVLQRHRLRSARRPRHGAYRAAVGLINRPRARLRQARPRARAYHRLSIGLPLRRPFGSQRRRLWFPLLSNDAPSEARTSLVASRRCTDSRPAATPAPQAVASPHAVTFAVPRASTSEATTAPPLRRGSPPFAHGLRHAAGSSSPTSCTAAAPPPQVAAGLANHFRSRWAHRSPQRPSRRPA